jgi:excinuclease ABC subunit C
MSVTRPDSAPEAPGVYEYLDPEGRVLYVGKAKNLKNRLASYFTGDHHPRTVRMLNLATTVRWTICASEEEALLLEREWIVKRQPPFNVRLRAGSGYGGVALTKGPVPRLTVWRGQRPKHAESFGPYPGIRQRELIDALTTVFAVRTCTDEEYRRAERNRRACLLGETGRCLAPCVDRDAHAPHAEMVKALRLHLKNPDPARIDAAREDMEAAAAAEHFEEAGRKRDHLRALEVIGRRQRVHGEGLEDVTAVVLRFKGERLVAAVTRAGGGSIESVEVVHGDLDGEADIGGNLEAVLLQLNLPEPPVTEMVVRGGRAARGTGERNLLAFAATQAEAAMRNLHDTGWRDPSRRLEALEVLKESLGAASARRIECLDISHGGGKHTVGSLITLIDGEPERSNWRRLELGELGGDDYRAIEEVIARRFQGNRLGFTEQPDILLIDGGPGQVNAALQGMRNAGLQPANLGGTGPYLLGIAKRFEELWPVGAATPLLLHETDPALLVLTMARDCAHANGVSTHRRRRDRAAGHTRLDGIAGLGERRRAALLAHFGTYQALLAAPASEIAAVRGIGEALAERIHQALHPAD